MVGIIIQIEKQDTGGLSPCDTLFLRGLPHSHSKNGDYIYNRQFNVMKRLGYDYIDR